jgi:hypothetical protein
MSIIDAKSAASVEARKAAMLEWLSETSDRNSKGRDCEGWSKYFICRSFQKLNVMAAV